MPTYDYRCDHCGYETELIQKISDEPLSVCPKCSYASFRRLIGAGAGLIFKGRGFYETDYKKSTVSKESASNSNSKTETVSKSSKTASDGSS